MVTLVNRLDRVAKLRETLLRNKEALIKAAILDCAFTYRESAMEVNTVQDRLAGFPKWRKLLLRGGRWRVPGYKNSKLLAMIEAIGRVAIILDMIFLLVTR